MDVLAEFLAEIGPTDNLTDPYAEADSLAETAHHLTETTDYLTDSFTEADS